ncbi:pimeloyl-ACP methyl ester carboxylesterase [Spinactinospora alkalitolerans]|uniref:Pimeloyl-ACP methyl ester carboxylesterase n=1 Tax=Spinactinospora alkalitolerans TaxID=687207 RepID=A0A852TUF0_9ACTN|nr:alpha/beta hydrolase [Spinactinospora alkalitolerans]NYE47065.1 pimeloyl-ACP methyl ester carboxylesterase [Spinactinospora alkalitolerans]
MPALIRPPIRIGREFTPAAGTRVHAAVVGPAAAEEVVCVHGLGCSHRYFMPFARALAPAFRAVAVDLPGFGRTPGPVEALDIRGLSRALADWLRASGRAGAPLVANSVGCQVVVDMAVHAPELMGPAVLNGPTMDRRARTLPRQLARLALDGLRERPSLGAVLARDYLDCGPRRLVATFAHALADPVERKLPRVRGPALVLRGTRDPVVPHEWGAEVAGLLPTGRLIEVSGFGHTLNYSAPEELARITRDLLDGERPIVRRCSWDVCAPPGC